MFVRFGMSILLSLTNAERFRCYAQILFGFNRTKNADASLTVWPFMANGNDMAASG